MFAWRPTRSQLLGWTSASANSAVYKSVDETLRSEA